MVTVLAVCVGGDSHETHEIGIAEWKRCEIFTDGQHSCSTALSKA